MPTTPSTCPARATWSAALNKLKANVTYLEVAGGSHTDVVVPNLPLAFEFMAAQKKGAATSHEAMIRSSKAARSIESSS